MKRNKLKYLVVCDDSLGYGSAIARTLRSKGFEADILSRSLNGAVPFLRDRTLPRLHLNKWHEYSFEKFQEAFIDKVKGEDYTSIIFLCGDVIVRKPAIDWIKRNKPSIQLVLWLYDRIKRLMYIHEQLPLFNMIYTFEDSDIELIKGSASCDVRPLYLFCDDYYYKPDASVNKDIDISFIGSWHGPYYERRRAILSAVSDLSKEHAWKFLVVGASGFGSPLKFIRDLSYARGFVLNVGSGPLRHNEINKIYQRSKVVINCPPDNQVDGYPMRTFEVSGSGTCLVTQYMPGIERLYGNDEIVVFNNVEELRMCLREILNTKEKREQIALAGMQRTLNEHTLSKRLDTLIA